MRVPLPQILYGQANQTLVADPSLPYVHVDNPTNARIVFENGQMVGPYTLNAVISIPKTNGSFIVDTSDVSYPNVAIFSNALINAWLTNEEHPNPGISYAPIANISSTITVSGNVNATVTNTINATITNASIPVTQSGVWNVSISNATINVSGSVSITSGIVTIGGTPNINIQSQSTNLATAQPQVALADLTFVVSGVDQTQTTVAVGAGVHALQLINNGPQPLTNFRIRGHITGSYYLPIDSSIGNTGFQLPMNRTVIIPINSSVDTQYDVTIAAITQITTIKVTSILDTQAIWVQNTELTPIFVRSGVPATYSASTPAFTPAANATDIFIISASSSIGRTIKVHRITLTCTQNVAGLILIQILKRETLNTGGATVLVMGSNYDSKDPFPSGSPVYYTGNPTALGSTNGVIRSLTILAGGSTTFPDSRDLVFGDSFTKPLTLNPGESTSVVVNLGGGALPAGLLTKIVCEWTEE